MNGHRSVNIANNVLIGDKGGNPVGFQAIDHYDASALFSDTVDLPTPGSLYVGEAGTLNLMLMNGTVALPYVFEQPGLYPLLVKRIMSTGSDSITTYITM